jgi:2-phosphosulfolactate phosphatase
VIDLAFTGAEARECDVAVVIDVLRATSTITQALSAGYRRVLCTDSLELALSLRRPGRIIAGERDCLPPDGFDHGNSPFEVLEPAGEELVLTSSNGTSAILACARRAETVLLAAALNIAAVADAICERVNPADAAIQIVCAGGDGRPCIEDTFVAGRIASELSGERTDSVVIAQVLSDHFVNASAALHAGTHARKLSERGFSSDIVLCGRTSTLVVVPTVATVEDGVAVVVDTARVPAASRVADR